MEEKLLFRLCAGRTRSAGLGQANWDQHLVVASMDVTGQDMSSGVITARNLFDGTNPRI